MPLPPAPYDACHKVATRVTSLSLVRYRNNDYSVPTRYGHQEVLAKGYVDRVEISCRGETIAVHARSYDKADFVYNPLHYLALLEHKSRALDQAAPLERVPFERNRSNDKKSLKIKMLEQALIEKVYQLFRSLL